MSHIEELAAALASDRFGHATLADDTGVLLDTSGREVMALNDTGNLVVECLLAGARTEDDLVAALVAEFEVDTDMARSDLGPFLDELSEVLLGD